MQEQLKAETHISEAAFRSLNLEEVEFKSKLQQTAEANNRTVQELRECQKELQATIDGLTKTEKANNRKVQELRESQKQLQATIGDQTKIVKANNRTVQELRENQKQLQANIDGLTKTVEALNQTVLLLRKHPKDVSTCKVETVSTSKWTEIPPAINIANFRPNNIVWYTYSASIIRACVAIFISRLCSLRFTPISYPFSTEL